MARRVSVSSVSSEKRIGKPFEYDPEFKGPRDRRSCTDILCLLLFVAFLVSWALLGGFAYRFGDPSRILTPTDVSGQKCGVDAAVIKKPYLLYFDPSLCVRPSANVLVNGCSSPSVCVEKCPTEAFYAADHYQKVGLASLRAGPICLPDVTPHNGAALKSAVERNQCALRYMKSKALGTYCIPDVTGVVDGAIVQNFVKGVNLGSAMQKASQTGDQIVSDIVASAPFIGAGLAGAMVLSLFYIMLLRWFTGTIVWVSIVAVLGALAAGIYVCYMYWEKVKQGDAVTDWADVPVEFRTWLDAPSTWLTLLIILGVILAVLLLMVLFLRKRISLAVTLIEQGGKAVASTTSALFFPIVPWVLQVAAVAYACSVLLYLATVGEAMYKTHGLETCTCDGDSAWTNGQECLPSVFRSKCANCVKNGASCLFFRYNPPDYIKWLHLYNVFGVLWMLFFISGMAQLILAATFATWYWTFHKSDVPFFVLTRSFFMAITYHTGTVAFGSLIISIVRLIRIILDYVEKQAKQYSNNSVGKCLMCFCKCCFACVEGFLRFISRNAYIMCAVHGKNFCASAKDAFNLLMRNAIRVVVLDKIMDFVFFMGKLLITALVCTAMYFSLLQWPQELNHNAVPITIAGIGTFFIASIFFGVYSVAVDTLFLCFLEDCERNDGSQEKPYYMSPSLMNIFGKKNRSRASE